ncbi:TIGR03086 family metal-binding protein [Actinomycetospora sp. C-140]
MDTAVLRRGLEQTADVLAGVEGDPPTTPTPCEGWTLQDLVDHVVAAPWRFAVMVRGEALDWSAPTPPAGGDPVAAFCAHATELLTAWAEHGDTVTGPGVDWQCAELAVHTWDLARTTGLATAHLDPEVAELGLAFMRAHLTADIRGPAFGPEQPAPDGADPYVRIAAFAGRRVGA